AASSVRSAAYCGRVRARSSISDGRSLARSCQSNGLKFWLNQSVLFRHPTNANSIAWQHLPKVLINRPISNRQGCCTSSQNSGFIAKYTINAARTFGIAEHIGSLEDGKMADVVVWRPAFFGIKPELVIKGGFIAWGAMGDSAASLMTCEPILMRPQWGAFGRAAPALSACFVHPLAIERGLKAELGLSKALLPARGT